MTEAETVERKELTSDYVERIALICHQTNKAYCETLGDLSQPDWKDAPDWQKESIMNGVRRHLINTLTPEQSHESWLAEKKKDGWVFGTFKDPEKKTHPCMIAYDDLPIYQKRKGCLFKSVVEAFSKY